MPDWTEPVARYIIEEGLVNTLKLSAIALVGSSLIGITLGTLLTIRFLPMRAVIRLYIEIWRGLPILVTIFIIFFALPAISASLRFDAHHGRRDRPHPLGKRAGGGDHARRRRLDPARAARGRLGTRLRLGRPARVRDPAAGAASTPSARSSACSSTSSRTRRSSRSSARRSCSRRPSARSSDSRSRARSTRSRSTAR